MPASYSRTSLGHVAAHAARRRAVARLISVRASVDIDALKQRISHLEQPVLTADVLERIAGPLEGLQVCEVLSGCSVERQRLPGLVDDVAGLRLVGAVGRRAEEANGGVEGDAEVVVEDPVVDSGGALLAVQRERPA